MKRRSASRVIREMGTKAARPTTHPPERPHVNLQHQTPTRTWSNRSPHCWWNAKWDGHSGEDGNHCGIPAWRIHGQRSPAGWRPWFCKESDMPEVTRHERTATLEDSFSVNYKTERKLIRQSSNPTPWYPPKGVEHHIHAGPARGCRRQLYSQLMLKLGSNRDVLPKVKGRTNCGPSRQRGIIQQLGRGRSYQATTGTSLVAQWLSLRLPMQVQGFDPWLGD